MKVSLIMHQNIVRLSWLKFSILEDCLAIKQENPGSTSGVHTIRPDFQESGVNVSCDMETGGGGWIVSWNFVNINVMF